MFIAVDKILDNLEKENKDTIDIFGFVKDMRTRRFNMVQTAVSLYKIKCEFSWCIFTTTRNQNKTCSVCRVKFARRNQTKTCSVWCETGSKIIIRPLYTARNRASGAEIRVFRILCCVQCLQRGLSLSEQLGACSACTRVQRSGPRIKARKLYNIRL